MTAPVSRPKSEPIAVAAAVIVNQGHFLIAQRQNGFWEFPGGKKEPEESLEEALKREIKEELAVDIQVEEPFVTIEHVYPDKAIRLHTFFCRLVAGQLEAVGCRDFKWVGLAEMKSHPLLSADERVAARLGELGPFEAPESCGPPQS